MRIAILTHFNSFQAGYALAVGWLERARLLEYYGVDFDFLVNESCPEGLYPHQRNCLTVVDSDRPFEERAKTFCANYEDVLADYDVILTADLIYQAGGNFLAQNAAMRLAQISFREQGRGKFWLHWIHSAWTEPNMSAQYPETLRHTVMNDSLLVYMNEAEMAGVAKQYQTSIDNVRCVYNPKDIRSFRDFHPLAWDITQALDIPNKDIVQIFPHCSTRMNAKGINEVVRAFAAFKRAGKSVALILANANAKAAKFDLDLKREWIERHGLVEGRDFLFTSDLSENQAPLARKAVSDLFMVSNTFVFGSWREVCPNALLEARISGNFLVVNEELPCAREFAGYGAAYFRGISKVPGKRDHSGEDLHKRPMSERDWDAKVKKLIPRIPDRSYMWEYSWNRIWTKQLQPLLKEAEARLKEVRNG